MINWTSVVVVAVFIVVENVRFPCENWLPTTIKIIKRLTIKLNDGRRFCSGPAMPCGHSKVFSAAASDSQEKMS